MNAESSRSHLILSIIVAVMDKATKKQTTGKLSLVDLVGGPPSLSAPPPPLPPSRSVLPLTKPAATSFMEDKNVHGGSVTGSLACAQFPTFLGRHLRESFLEC
jgi:hypothetical protein